MVKLKDENLVIKLWHQFTTNNPFIQHLSKFMQFVEPTIVQVIRNVEDEKTFSILTFMKSKLQNQLAMHLDITICMVVQNFFTKEMFPFQVIILH
jgi:hypothetical protein